MPYEVCKGVSQIGPQNWTWMVAGVGLNTWGDGSVDACDHCKASVDLRLKGKANGIQVQPYSR